MILGRLGRGKGKKKISEVLKKNSKSKKVNGRTSTHELFSDTLNEEKLHKLITRRAHEFYKAKGCVPGDDLADWYKAEVEIKKRYGIE
ncbi:MAG: DUF2934 domain-containing protein [Candidatus Omnitrophota bacterium]